MKKRYKNPHVGNARRRPWDFLLWKFGYYDDARERKEPPKDFRYPFKESFDGRKPYALWINHATFLIRAHGLTLLTDPLWAEYCSPVPFKRLKRKHPPGIEIEALPDVDIILISHNHYDHLCAKTVAKLRKRFPEAAWIVAKGVKKWFRKRNIAFVEELGWWESAKLYKKALVTAVPAQHFSGRSLFDRNKTHWNGYVVEFGDKTLYFSGDTGYNRIDFRKIGKRWKKIDLSLIPIGTYAPRKFMKPVHVSPREAVHIHKDVQSEKSIGMHWKTFHLSEEPIDLPPYELYLELKKEGISPKKFLAVEPGSYVNW